MAEILDIQGAVITGEVLRAQHAGQGQVRVRDGAIVTPSAWDYIRGNRLQLVDGRAAATGAAATPSPAAPAGTPISEVLPPGTEVGVLSQGRCDHPERNFGCRTEEFGSGFVEPSSCSDCAVKKAQAAGASCGCGGCNKATGNDPTEALVQSLTDEIMKRLQT